MEADNIEAAVDAAYDKGAPGLMNLDHTYPDTSDWEVPEWFIKDNEETSN